MINWKVVTILNALNTFIKMSRSLRKWRCYQCHGCFIGSLLIRGFWQLWLSVIFGGIDACWSSFTIGTFWTLDFRSWFSGFFIYFNFFFTIPQTSEFDFCECQLIVYFWFSQKSKKLSKLTQEKKRKLKYSSSMKEIWVNSLSSLKESIGLNWFYRWILLVFSFIDKFFSRG